MIRTNKLQITGDVTNSRHQTPGTIIGLMVQRSKSKPPRLRLIR